VKSLTRDRITTLLLTDHRWRICACGTGSVVVVMVMGLVALLAGKVARRRPLAGIPGLDVLQAIHDVDVLQTECPGFVEEEPDKKRSSQIAGGKHVAVGVRDSVGRDRG